MASTADTQKITGFQSYTSTVRAEAKAVWDQAHVLHKVKLVALIALAFFCDCCRFIASLFNASFNGMDSKRANWFEQQAQIKKSSAGDEEWLPSRSVSPQPDQDFDQNDISQTSSENASETQSEEISSWDEEDEVEQDSVELFHKALSQQAPIVKPSSHSGIPQQFSNHSRDSVVMKIAVPTLLGSSAVTAMEVDEPTEATRNQPVPMEVDQKSEEEVSGLFVSAFQQTPSPAPANDVLLQGATSSTVAQEQTILPQVVSGEQPRPSPSPQQEEASQPVTTDWLQESWLEPRLWDEAIVISQDSSLGAAPSVSQSSMNPVVPALSTQYLNSVEMDSSDGDDSDLEGSRLPGSWHDGALLGSFRSKYW